MPLVCSIIISLSRSVWIKEELEFNVIVGRIGTWIWGASKDLTLILRKPEKESDVIENTVEFLTLNGEFEVWSSMNGTLFLVLGKKIESEPDSDDFCPEGRVTK